MKKINDSGKKNNWKYKKVFIMVVSIILIYLIVLFTLHKLDIISSTNRGSNSSYHNVNQLTNVESLTYSPVSITCGDDETAAHVVYGGDNLYCTFSIVTNVQGVIDEIWFDYEYNDRFKYLDSDLKYDKTILNTNYSIEKDKGKVNIIASKLNFKFEDGVTNNLYDFYTIEFKSPDKYSAENYEPIYLSNIIIKTIDNRYYKYDKETSANGSIMVIENENTYSYVETDNVIDFYKGKEKINTYKCTGDDSCFVGAYMGANYIDLDIGRSLITDTNSDKSNKYLLFDFNKGILKQLDELDGTLVKKYEENFRGALTVDYKTHYILGRINNEQVIIDLDGNIIKNLGGYDLFKSQEGKSGSYMGVYYSIDNNQIVLGKNNKKGIFELTTNKVIVDYKYDDIYLYDKQYFKFKLNDLWYIGKLKTGSGINDLGYKHIFMVDNDLMVAQIDNYLYIKKFDGTNLVEDKIEVFYDYQFIYAEDEAYGISVHKSNTDKNVVNIDLTTKPTSKYKTDFETISYEYNIRDKKLTKTSN